jgi:FKBP-type peptidyl-prolyl cis-trans isomerase 2
MKRLVLIVISLGLIFNLSLVKTAQGGKNMAIKDGTKVKFDYTLTVDDETVDSSKERGPLEYTHGEGKIIPGLANELEGLKQGDEKEITLPPEKAYGKVNKDAVREFPKSSLPQDQEPKVGMLLQVQTQNGQVIPAKIAEVKEDTIVLDLNHPLAGKTLNFDIKILSVEE